MRRVLVLGGTAWLGAEVVRAALTDGSEVTCLARGNSGSAPEGARFVRADRSAPGAYDDLAGEWDEVVDLATAPSLVATALDALAHRTRHWTFISTVSVYARNDEPEADESAALVKPDDPTDYAQAKAAAERACAARVADRLLLARPGLIVGPGDRSDRFGYWPARLHRDGPVLAPTTAGRFAQVIDVADLAAWIVRAGRDGVTGPVNAVGCAVPLETLFDEVRAATGFDGDLVTADDTWLLDHDVRHWAGPRSLPLWVPASETGFMRRSGAAFRAAGGTNRPLGETVARVLEDEVSRGTARPRRSGLSIDDEAELLAALPR